MSARVGIEKRIILAAAVFVVSLTGLIGLSVRLFGIGLPTCLADVKPFNEGKVILQAPKRYEIHYVARMWKFEPATIDLLPGSTADIYVSSADVTHGLNIVGTNVNLEVVPGAVNYARVRFDRPGRYLVVCNEYCGTNHQSMAGFINVTEHAAPPAMPAPPHVDAKGEARGHELIEQYACTACHSIDGSAGAGPTFKGMWGQTIQLKGGGKVEVNEAYLVESIEKPGLKIDVRFDASMPEMPLAPDEVKAIAEYIRTLH